MARKAGPTRGDTQDDFIDALGPVREQLIAGRSEREIAAGLVEAGWDKHVALAFAEDLAATDEEVKRSPERRRALRRRYARLMGRGVIWAVGWPVLVTVCCYLALGLSEEIAYTASAGPALYGIGLLVRGLVGWVGHRERRQDR
jgi:hypothetical protein